jgi:hypothetical protein
VRLAFESSQVLDLIFISMCLCIDISFFVADHLLVKEMWSLRETLFACSHLFFLLEPAKKTSTSSAMECKIIKRER